MAEVQVLAASAAKKKTKRVRYLINPDFQLRHTLVFMIISLTLCAIICFRLYGKIKEKSNLVIVGYPQVTQILEQSIKQDRYIAYEIIGFLLFGLVITGVVGIMMTHRIAGPHYVINQYLKQIAKGKFPRMRRFRTGDELLDLDVYLNTALDTISERAQIQRDILENVHAYLLTKQDISAQHLALQLQEQIQILKPMCTRSES